MQPLTFFGRVEKGEGMAKRLGCPTANIAIEQGAVIPALGVYVGETLFEGKQYPSLVCINDGRTGYRLKMEVHLFDVNREFIGKHLTVNLLEKLRDLVAFEGEDKMSKMVEQDLKTARDWFAKHAGIDEKS